MGRGKKHASGTDREPTWLVEVGVLHFKWQRPQIKRALHNMQKSPLLVVTISADDDWATLRSSLLRGAMHDSFRVSTYRVTRQLPEPLRMEIPSIEDLREVVAAP